MSDIFNLNEIYFLLVTKAIGISIILSLVISFLTMFICILVNIDLNKKLKEECNDTLIIKLIKMWILPILIIISILIYNKENNQIKSLFDVQTITSLNRVLDGNLENYDKGLIDNIYNKEVTQLVYLNKQELNLVIEFINDSMKDKKISEFEMSIINNILKFATNKKYTKEYVNKVYEVMLNEYLKNIMFSKSKEEQMNIEKEELRNRIEKLESIIKHKEATNE